MSREIRADYDQVLLFPPSVEDWVGEGHPARFIRDFVDLLDLPAMGFRVRPSEEGRPNYASDLLLKVWVYGYFNGIRSTRRLEMACLEHMGLIWLTGMIVPDHNSLWRFWRDNKKALREVFKASVQVAAKAGLVGLVVHAVDGTKLMARSSQKGMVRREDLEKLLDKLDASLEEMMKGVERAERKERGEYRLPASLQSVSRRREVIAEALGELQRAGKNLIHPCEPEARMIKTHEGFRLSYNAQVVADGASGMIVASDVVNDESDNALLVPMLDQVKENVGACAEENVADGAYFSSAQLGMARERGYEVLTNESSGEKAAMRGSEDNPYHQSRFTFDREHDCWICPHGGKLRFQGVKEKNQSKMKVRRYRCHDFRTCSYHQECSGSKRGRTIDLNAHNLVLEQHRDKRNNRAKRKLLEARKVMVEPVFAWIKRHEGFTRWTVCGLENVRTQWSLMTLTINLRKLYRNWRNGKFLFAQG